MRLLVRTWNVFHGNAKRPERMAFLREAVALAASDRPDVLCLQELPLWSLNELGEWSGMRALGEVAAPAAFGPIPITRELGHALTARDYGRYRSAFTGQGNAILLGDGLTPLARRSLTLNSFRFRRAQARWLGLPLVTRLAWAKERRVCQAVRFVTRDGETGLVANLHATSLSRDRRLADAELLRAAVFADALAAPQDVCILAGDFNVTRERSRTLLDLATPEWGFSPPGPGIDHILVRGARSGPPFRWPAERRRLHGRIVSDHAPVEVRVG